MLLEYRQARHLSVQSLAELCEEPKRTVYDWLNGKAPSLRRMKDVCKKLDVDFDKLMAPERLRRFCIQKHSLRDYNQHYIEQTEQDPFMAMNVVWHAAMEVMALLGANGHKVSSLADISPDTQILWHEDSPLAGLRLMVGGHGEHGLFMQWSNRGHPITGKWIPLSEDNLLSSLPKDNRVPRPATHINSWQ